MQTRELIGSALDWAVHCAIHGGCEGYSPHGYSTDWAQGGRVLEAQGISVGYDVELSQEEGRQYWATILAVDSLEGRVYGPTALVAAMRCLVAARLGDDIDVPAEFAA